MDIVDPSGGIIPTLYRHLLRFLPSQFRAEAESELVAWFDAAWREARRTGVGSRARVLVVALLDLARSIPAEWLVEAKRPRVQAPRVRKHEASQMETLWQDCRYAWRVMRAAPAVSIVAALTVAIGIGATTTMFSVANALLLRPPVGVAEPDRLVTVHALDQSGSSFHSFSYLDYKDLEASGSGLSSLSGYGILAASVRTGAEPKLEVGMLVSGNYFETLGTRAELGRFFAPEEDQPGGPRVVVLSHSLWQRLFAGDRSVLGRTLVVNGQPLTVIGVTEPGFQGHFAAVDMSLWAPMALQPVLTNRDDISSRNSSWLELIGRLAPGTTRAQAAAALSAVMTQLGKQQGSDWDRRVDVRRYLPVPASVALPLGGFLGLLVTLAGFVLLIASANVGNVLLARAAGRSQEIAVRLALGAGRGRLIRQLVTESILLFLAGGVAGTLLAMWAVRALTRISVPSPVPFILDFHLDIRVLAASLLVTLLAGIAFGLAPALQATRTDLAGILRGGLAVLGLNKSRFRGGMVAAQIAGTAFLLVVAGLFGRALGKAGRIDPGFRPAGVYVMSLQLQVRGLDGQRIVDFTEALERRAAAIPQVVSVASTDLLPLNLSNQATRVALEGRAAEPNVGLFEAGFTSVTPGYLETMGIPLSGGRGIAAADRDGAPRVAIVNQTMAQRFWPGENPIGKRFGFGEFDPNDATEVVGVAADSKYESLGEDPRPMMYVPLAQQPRREVTLLVRTAPGAPPPTRELRAALHDVDSEMPVAQEGSLSDIIAVGLLPNRVALMLATLFGATGLTLAAVGLYGLLAYRVQRRRREIGIRMALGASAAHVGRLVVGEAVRVSAIGIGIGLVLAGGASLLLRSLLFGVTPIDPATYGGIALLLLVVGALAAAGPAWRALRTNPMEVLRHD